MLTFEILCTTMHQHDFSKLAEMNIHSNIVYANQADTVRYDECHLNGYRARMITTNTRGVGKNRNIALTYADADICLLADDDVIYDDHAEKIILDEFNSLKGADAIIFNVLSDNLERPEKINHHPRRMRSSSPNPYGTYRIAVRLDAVRRRNLWFSTLFGGGAPYSCGEDSLFVYDMLRCGLRIYVSDKEIAHVKQECSSWFKGMNERYFYDKGAFYQAAHKGVLKYLYVFYFAARTVRMSPLSSTLKIRLMLNGIKGYRTLAQYEPA